MTISNGVRVRVGVSGLAGGGVTSGELATAVADRAPADATYITQTASAGLSAEQALGALGTGILKNTTTTGVLSIAVGADLPSHQHTAVQINLPFVLDGGGSAIDTGLWYAAGIMLPTSITIIGYILNGDDDIVITVQRAVGATTTTFGDISGTEKPTLSGVTAQSDVSLSTWTTAIDQFDRLRVSVDSATATYATLNILALRAV